MLGVVVTVGVALAGVGLFAVGSRGWFGKDALQVQVGFPEVHGVEVGTRVRIKGVDAGQVVSISLEDGPDSMVLLGLRIKGEHARHVYASSRVQIVPEGALGGKVIEVRPPRRLPGQPAPDLSPASQNAMLAYEPSLDFGDIAARGGEVLGKAGTALERMPGMIDEAVTLFRSTRETAEKGKETLGKINTAMDAPKRLPFVGGAFKGAADILVRENGEWDREVFAEGDLFEVGRAVLTSAGREKLDEVGANWLKQRRHSGSEVVIVSYADPGSKITTENAKLITQQQSEAVAEYLKKNHGAHKLSAWGVGPVGTRKVTALGMGLESAPRKDSRPLPASRVEVLVFKPQK